MDMSFLPLHRDHYFIHIPSPPLRSLISIPSHLQNDNPLSHLNKHTNDTTRTPNPQASKIVYVAVTHLTFPSHAQETQTPPLNTSQNPRLAYVCFCLFPLPLTPTNHQDSLPVIRAITAPPNQQYKVK